MAVSAYTLSLVARQRLFLRERFAARFPGWWLVWEPGPWRPARSTLEGDTATTRLDGHGAARPEGDDAFCFELPVKACSLTLGRESTCDVYLNDLTLSREHLRLETDGRGWTVELLPQATAVAALDGASLVPHAKHVLHSGARLQAGEVVLRLYDSHSFLSRLAMNSAA